MHARWLLAFLLLPGLVAAAEFTTWQVPWEKTRPRDPAVDSEGQVWFVGQGGDYVGRLDPASGKFARFDLPDGAGPHNVIVGKDGALWIAGNQDGWIGRMNAANGELETFSTEAKGVDDPHTLIQAADGRIWFTAQQSNRVGVFNPSDESLRVWKVPTKNARPYGIVMDRNDQPWIVLLGTNRLATVKNDELHEIALPRDEARPRRLDIIDGDIWYVDYVEGFVGRYDPAKREFKEWRSPSGEDAAPYGAIAAGDTFYYVETGPQPNRMIGIDSASGEVTYNEEIPESGGAVRHMFYDKAHDAVWFGTDSNYIVRFEPPRGEQ